MNKKRILQITAAVALIALTVLATVLVYPYIAKLADSEVRQEFSEKIKSVGPLGIVIMLGLQIVQVIFAVIPGEPVEILMGVLYGTWWGMLLCLAGIAIGSAIIFFAVSRLGRNAIEKMMESEKYKKFKFLRDPAKRDSLLFLLFLIPGTPKDLLTYVAPCTGIEPLRFLIICVIARIPSVVSSTYVGANLLEGNLYVSLGVLAVTALLGLIGIWINDRFLAKKNEKPS